MTFRRGARLNPGQVRDIRGQGRGGGGGGIPGLGGGGGFGRSGGGGGGLPIPAGGSIGSLVVIVIVIAVMYFLTRGSSGGTGVTDPGPTGPGGSGSVSECLTGEDANERLDCRIVGFVNSVQDYWTTEYTSRGENYREARTTLFTEFVDTQGCGGASAQVGPFYCPADENVYIELGFFDVLETQYGASGGSLAQGYVVAHEYGHHIQNLTGVLGRSQDGTTGAQSSAVRVELQADCYAGVWAANAVDTELLEPITESQLQDALSAAAAVGDDRIQEKSTGQVDPHTWTHGSAAQRQAWFTTGYREGDPDACDTFAGRI